MIHNALFIQPVVPFLLLLTCKQTLIFTNLFIIQIIPGFLHKHIVAVSFAQNLLCPNIFFISLLLLLLAECN